MAEEMKSFTCQICKRQRATGLWLLKKKSGSHEVKLTCTLCWFTELPQRTTILEIVFLQSLLADERHTETEECELGLIPTGEATILKSIEEVPQLLGVFFEMKCNKCGFLIDIAAKDVNAAKVSFPHPNRLYDA